MQTKSETPPIREEKRRHEVDVGENYADVPAKSGFLRIDPWLGRRSLSFVFIFFTAYATIFGGILSSGLYWILYGLPPLAVWSINMFTAAAVSAPAIFYSQSTIRKLARARRGLAEASERLSFAYDGAEAASRSKSAFLAHMSHELRTPLNVIIGFSDILIGNKRDADQKRFEYYEDIKSSGEHLLGIINDIIDISRIEAGHSELLDDVIDLQDILGSVKRMMMPIAAGRGVELIIDPINGSLPDLRGGERLIRQMLLNLLSNALKFTASGGRVSVAVALLPTGWLRILVGDTGIGMDSSNIERALLLFGQVDNSLARNYQGAGLGLPLSKTMVESHGGLLEIESEPGRGTDVALLFPPERVIARQ